MIALIHVQILTFLTSSPWFFNPDNDLTEAEAAMTSKSEFLSGRNLTAIRIAEKTYCAHLVFGRVKL